MLPTMGYNPAFLTAETEDARVLVRVTDAKVSELKGIPFFSPRLHRSHRPPVLRASRYEGRAGWRGLIAGLKLVPAPEGEAVVPRDDGTVALLAKDATTFSEKMRYEPKEEKNCLGYWALAEDWAQWEFEVAAASEYAVSVFQGCGSDGGSKVAVEAGGKELSFVVEGTGGFQNWKELKVGTLALEAGPNTLAIRPVEQVGKAVMDIQKIVLTPVK